MQTLNEIETREHNERQRAWSYQNLLADLERYRNAVAQQAPKIEAITAVLKQLVALQELAAQLPREVTGTGDVILREQIFLSTAQAAKRLNHRRDKAQATLDKAKADVVRLEEQLKEYESA